MTAATPNQVSSNREKLRLGDLGGTVFRTAGIVGIVGIVVSIGLGLMLKDSDRFYRSYLMAFVFVLSIALGGLFFTLVQHATRAGWSVVLRRLSEGVAANLAWLWVLFIPVVIALWDSHIYHWVHPAPDDHLLAHKAPFLNVPFWLIRAVFYFLVWGGFSLFLLRNSVAQDERGDVSLTHRMQRIAPVGILLYALTQSFAAVDWVMSLESHWFSTMFGVYFFAASACGFLATLILFVFFLQRKGRLEDEITLEHYQDMGKFLFAFGVVFWAYIAFSQFMLIWYANLPEETTWYLARILGGWKGVSWFLLVGHFLIPFVLLVTKHTKRIKPVLAGIAMWMLLMAAVDIYWLVMPMVPAAEIAAATSIAELDVLAEAGELNIGWHPHLLDLTCLIGLGGFFVAGTAYRLRSCNLVPTQDPRLAESLAFENM